jgi:hypothetical protein
VCSESVCGGVAGAGVVRSSPICHCAVLPVRSGPTFSNGTRRKRLKPEAVAKLSTILL